MRSNALGLHAYQRGAKEHATWVTLQYFRCPNVAPTAFRKGLATGGLVSAIADQQ